MKKPKPGKKRGNRTPWSRSDIVKKGWATRRAMAKAEARAARARSAAVKKSWVTRRKNAEEESKPDIFNPEQFERGDVEYDEIEKILREEGIDPDTGMPFDQGDDEADEDEEEEEDEGDVWNVEEPIASSKKKQYKAPTAAPILNWAENPIFENKQQQAKIEPTEAPKQSGASPVRSEQRARNKGVGDQARKASRGKSKIRAKQRARNKGVGDQARKRDKRGRFVGTGKHSKPVKGKRRP